ncbi:MAG: hypothetical protein A2068_08800 [Ignavibacteria bacterium GWB2_35_6b]|nr:MAG: hypothetical protein A2068_08800 [Ignavibacteria bacterium GWB2_35_6b]
MFSDKKEIMTKNKIAFFIAAPIFIVFFCVKKLREIDFKCPFFLHRILDLRDFKKSLSRSLSLSQSFLFFLIKIKIMIEIKILYEMLFRIYVLKRKTLNTEIPYSRFCNRGGPAYFLFLLFS